LHPNPRLWRHDFDDDDFDDDDDQTKTPNHYRLPRWVITTLHELRCT
jgi:hypothetical protein